MMFARLGWRKWPGGALTALLVVAGLSAMSVADRRIVSESEDERSEVLVKDGRILSRTDPNTWFLIDCVPGGK